MRGSSLRRRPHDPGILKIELTLFLRTRKPSCTSLRGVPSGKFLLVPRQLYNVSSLFQATTPYAYMFIALHHNVSTEATSVQEAAFRYTYGLKDLCVTFFYFLIS